jgi:hypothetical protein
MYLQKVTSRKIVLKNKFFAGILKVIDENSRVRIQDPDPLFRGMDPRIRIHTQGFGSGSAWIRINLSCWIRIRIKIADPDPDPGGQK